MISNEELIAISFRNRVTYTDRDELLRIYRGERATKVYKTPNQLKGLRERGILEIRYGGFGDKHLALTAKAELLLISTLEEEP